MPIRKYLSREATYRILLLSIGGILFAVLLSVLMMHVEKNSLRAELLQQAELEKQKKRTAQSEALARKVAVEKEKQLAEAISVPSQKHRKKKSSVKLALPNESASKGYSQLYGIIQAQEEMKVGKSHELIVIVGHDKVMVIQPNEKKTTITPFSYAGTQYVKVSINYSEGMFTHSLKTGFDERQVLSTENNIWKFDITPLVVGEHHINVVISPLTSEGLQIRGNEVSKKITVAISINIIRATGIRFASHLTRYMAVYSLLSTLIGGIVVFYFNNLRKKRKESPNNT